MFGLSIREKLIKITEKAIVQELNVYRRAMLKSCQLAEEHPDEMTDEVVDLMSDKCTKVYLDAVANSVYKDVGGSSQKANTRIMMAGMNPKLCGYPDIDVDRQMAGSVYAICFWALKNKEAEPADCIYLNHAQDACMHRVLVEIGDDQQYELQGLKEMENWQPSDFPPGARIQLDLRRPQRPSSLINCSAEDLMSRYKSGRIVKDDLKNALRADLFGFKDPKAEIAACRILLALDEAEENNL